MRKVTPVLVIALMATACGVDAGSPATTTTAPSAATTTTVAGTTTTVPPATTTSAPAPTTTGALSTTSTLPGQSVDFGPRAGDTLMVIGVGHDDTLNLRAAPGTTQPILGTIPPMEMNLKAAGETRTFSGAFWTKVDHQGKVGWVHMGFVGYPGGVEDQTAAVVAHLGEYPTAATMTALGEIIAAVFESDEVEVQSRVVQVSPVSSGDLHEVVFDVIGFADDAVGGARLHIFAERVSDGYSLKSVEVMGICLRGVDAEGLCV